MSDYSPRSLAYLGDAVLELWVRDYAIRHRQKAEGWHKFATSKVNAEFQCTLLDHIEHSLSEDEKEIIRQGRNAPISVGRRHNQQIYRKASGFETLIGHLHLSDPARLSELLTMLRPFLEA